MIENVPSKGVNFSDLMCTFAKSVKKVLIFFATLSLVILLTVQNSEQYFTAQELIKNYY